MRIGIDASNVGGGGGITHLKEILMHYNNVRFEHEISTITVYSSQKVLDALPVFKGLIKKTFPELNSGLIKRVVFQITKYDKYIFEECDVLFSVTGDYIGKFMPVVGMSRNMLLYERDVWKEIGQPKEIIRFWLNYYKQKKSFSNSSGIIFISNYAKEYVKKYINLHGKEIKTINHGVSVRFLNSLKLHQHISNYSSKNPFKLAYVSPVHVYKHQWNVVKAVSILRKEGFPIELQIIGNIIFQPAGKKLLNTISEVDPERNFIKYKGYVSYDEIDKIYNDANGLIFASTCENMPNTLIECMSSGTVIACSHKQPMPEFLKDNGYYFDAKNVLSIVDALREMLNNPSKNYFFAKNNLEEVKKYNWTDTSLKTFEFLIEVFNNHKSCVE